MPTRELKDLTPNLQTVFLTLVARFKLDHADKQLKLICAHRTPQEQYELWLKGRDEHGEIVDRKKVVTFCDGRITKSKHNHLPSFAFDVGIFEGKKYLPDSPLEKTLGRYTFGLRVKWGGDFRSFKDYPHFEEV